MKKLVVVSFGTRYEETREKTIGAIERRLGEAFPEYEISRVFTSSIVVRLIRELEGIEIPTFPEWIASMEKEVSEPGRDHLEEILVVPTYFMKGKEFHRIQDQLKAADFKDVKVRMAEPLVDSDEDMREVLDALIQGEKKASTAYCYMGHGTDVAANEIYARMQGLLNDMDEQHLYIGTVEAEPSIHTICEKLEGKGYQKVVLQPMMIVAGGHAVHDMAGEEKDSWKSVLEGHGYEVECVLKGFGEMPEIQEIYVKHALHAKEIQ